MRVRLRRLLRFALSGLIVGAVALQFVRPAKTNPVTQPDRSIQAHTQMPADVTGILKRACADCHSNETTWPWYSNVAPVSWFVIDHVNHGRKHLNLSEWTPENQSSVMTQDHHLAEIYEEVKSNRMPLSSYTLMHPEARLGTEEKERLCKWVIDERRRITEEQLHAGDSH